MMMKLERSLTTDELVELAQAMKDREARPFPLSVEKSVSSYDLARPSRLPKSKAGALESVLRDTTRAWADAMRSTIGDDASVSLDSIERMTFGCYSDALSGAELIAVAEADGLGTGIAIELPAQMALSIVNRMSGGRGIAPSARSLTAIEVNLMRRPIATLRDGLAVAWNGVAPVEFGPASICRFASEAGWHRDQALAIAHLTCRASNSVFGLAVAIRSGLLDCLPDEMTRRDDNRPPLSPRNVGQVREMIGHVPVEISADLGHARLNLRDVLGMQVGDVLRLDRTVNQAIPFKIGKRVAFRGRPGLAGNRLSVRIENNTVQSISQHEIEE